jgi:hypothetical protein
MRALAVSASSTLAIATGRSDILGREVTKGRVAYLCFENPDDVRMRIKVAAYLLDVDIGALSDKFVILGCRAKPNEIVAMLAPMAEDGAFTLVLVDTFAAFFDGDQVNDPVQAGEFMRRLRPLTQIAGRPAVIVSAHPTKNAGENALIPYGAGAILNEVDGNLTLWRDETGLVSLHWQGKLRGLEFGAVPFRFEITGCPDILDVKGRQVQLPTLRPSSAETAEEREEVSVNQDVALLKAMREDADGSVRTWAVSAGLHRSSVERRLVRLATPKGGKLTRKTLSKWTITAAGIEAIKERA